MIHVAVAVILNSDRNAVLMARRQAHQHLAGLWEFPGGKCEEGEDVRQALLRELDEEVGLMAEMSSLQELIRHQHAYEDRLVCLDVWVVTAYTGQPHGREGQPVEWVPVHELEERSMPEGNRPIIRALRTFLSAEGESAA